MGVAWALTETLPGSQVFAPTRVLTLAEKSVKAIIKKRNLT
jgi:hypothetical protein